MSHHRSLAALVVLIAALVAGCAGSQGDTDLVVTNARIWTGDPERPTATALLVRNGRFAYVGDDETARNRAGKSAKLLDLRGRRLIPGLIDAHLHILSGGLQLSRLNLRDLPNRAAFIDAVANRARQTPKGAWIQGGRWSTESWPDPAQPNKAWIDSVTPDHPVLLSRMDGHGALANSVALRIAGIDRDGPPDPAGGEIERDAKTGMPTGILKDAAIGLVSRHIPPPTSTELDRALVAAMREANRHGLTGVHTMSPWSALAVFERARAAGRLTLRIRHFVSEADWREFLDRAARGPSFTDDAGSATVSSSGDRCSRQPTDDWLRVVGFKQFMDGSLGSRTAYMAAPYTDNPPDAPDRRGLLSEVMHTEGQLQAMCDAAAAAGFSLAIHAIGDQANHLVLDIYARVRQRDVSEPGRRASRKHRQPRLRIEHAQHLLPQDIRRFGELGVVASMQPLHKADDGRYAEKAIGSTRCRTSYAFRDLLNSNAHLAFGSDWPVVSLNPFLGVEAAVTGRTLNGKVFVPEQNISVEEALRAYTSGAAYAAGDENRLGMIKPGYLADFVVLRDDPLRVRPDTFVARASRPWRHRRDGGATGLSGGTLSVAPGALKNIRVQETYVGGERVWPIRTNDAPTGAIVMQRAAAMPCGIDR